MWGGGGGVSWGGKKGEEGKRGRGEGGREEGGKEGRGKGCRGGRKETYGPAASLVGVRRWQEAAPVPVHHDAGCGFEADGLGEGGGAELEGTFFYFGGAGGVDGGAEVGEREFQGNLPDIEGHGWVLHVDVAGDGDGVWGGGGAGGGEEDLRAADVELGVGGGFVGLVEGEEFRAEEVVAGG